MVEKAVRAAIVRYLDSVTGLVWWPVVPGRSGAAGVPDISAVYRGRYIGIEIKRNDGGKVAPLQRAWHQRIAAAGGIVIIARSVDDVREVLDKQTEVCYNSSEKDFGLF